MRAIFCLFYRPWSLALCLLFSIFAQQASATIGVAQNLWFAGSPDEAFVRAKFQNKPILLYWGANWCPACNELNSQIFKHPNFGSLTNPFMRVYLDGDREAAQVWGEKLHISSYPTILLLSPEGKEFLRIVESVDWEEFKETMEAALLAQGGFDEALQMAQKDPAGAPQTVWQMLAYSRWFHEDTSSQEKARLLAAREALISKVPDIYEKEKTLLVAGLIIEASSTKRSEDQNLSAMWQRTDKKLSSYFDIILAGQNSIWASREMLTDYAEPVLQFAHKKLSPEQFTDLSLRWIRAAEFIRTRKKASADLKLAALHPQIVITRLFQGATKNTETQKALKESIKEAVGLADSKAIEPLGRHSAMTRAADLLQEVGEVNAARSLLLKELQKSTAPWYYQGALAVLEEKRANKKEALVWSRLAKESAKGNATKLQWLVNDLLLNAKLAPNQTFTINKLLREYYDLAFSLPDGFKGRNARRFARLMENLPKLTKQDTAINGTLRFYKQRCSLSKGSVKDSCEKLFASLLPKI